MTPEVLKVVNAAKTYRVSGGFFRGNLDLSAVSDVSFTVRQGEVLGLVGESGCGKTTMAKMILGLESLTRGDIFVKGRSIRESPYREIARKVQPIFQDPYSSLNPRKSIGSIISLPLRALGIGSRRDWDEKVKEIMELVGLPPNLRHNYPNQLSGGQRQRVAVARALIMRPEIVLCDEPTSALDVSVQAQILNLLIDLREALGLTYILISHNLAVVEHLATSVAVMYLGRIVEQGPAAEIFREPLHPYTQTLLASVLTPDPDKGLPEVRLDAEYPNPIEMPPGCSFHPRCPRAEEICKTALPETLVDGERKVACHFPGPLRGTA